MSTTALDEVRKKIANRFSDSPEPVKEPEVIVEDPIKKQEPDPAKDPQPVKKEPEPEPVKKPDPVEPDDKKDLVGDDDEIPDFTKPSENSRERETLAQQRAKENGQKLKQAEMTIAERDAEISRLQSELAKRTETPRLPREEEIFSMPEISSIRDSVSEDARSVAVTQDNDVSSEIIMNQFPALLGGWVTDGKDNTPEFRKKVREQFLAAYRESPDHDPDSENALAAEHVKSVLNFCVRNEARVAEIQKKVEEVVNRAKEGVSTIGFEHWNEQSNILRKSAFSVMELPDDADPHSVAAVVKSEINTSNEAKERYNKIVDAVTTVILGPKVMTEAELRTIEKNGISLKEFHKRRAQKHQENRERLVAQIAQALYLVNQFPDLYRDALEIRETRAASEQLKGGGIKDRQPEPPAKTEPAPVTRATFKSSIEQFLG